MARRSRQEGVCMKQRMPAKLQEIDRICEEVRESLGALGLEQMFFEVTLLLREALVNAVVHGSQGDERKWVGIDLSVRGDELVVDVQDEGPGFAWREQMQQDASANEDHGRGLSIFQAYANSVQYNEEGNRVTLRKTLAD